LIFSLKVCKVSIASEALYRTLYRGHVVRLFTDPPILVWSIDTYTVKSENLSLTPMPPHPSPLPAGEREGVRGNFKCVWLEFGVWICRIMQPICPTRLDMMRFMHQTSSISIRLPTSKEGYPLLETCLAVLSDIAFL
jgi:hypothetical protein